VSNMDETWVREVLDDDVPDRELTPGFEADLRTMLAETWRHGDAGRPPRSPGARTWLLVGACVALIGSGVVGIVALRPGSTSPTPAVAPPATPPTPVTIAPTSLVAPSTTPPPTSPAIAPATTAPASTSSEQSSPPSTVTDVPARTAPLEASGPLPGWMSFDLPDGDHDVDLGVIDGRRVRILKTSEKFCIDEEGASSSCTGPLGAVTSMSAEWGGDRPLNGGPSFREWLLPADVTLTVAYDDGSIPCDVHRTAIPEMTDIALWTCQSPNDLFERKILSTFVHGTDTFTAAT
jgi:hypothetical protein